MVPSLRSAVDTVTVARDRIPSGNPSDCGRLISESYDLLRQLQATLQATYERLADAAGRGEVRLDADSTGDPVTDVLDMLAHATLVMPIASMQKAAARSWHIGTAEIAEVV